MSIKLTQNGTSVDLDLNFPGDATLIIDGSVNGIAIKAPDGYHVVQGIVMGDFEVKLGPNGSGPGGVGRALYVDDLPPPLVESEYSVSFDNVDNHVDLNNAVILPRSGPCSISWWERSKEGSGNYPSRFRFRCDSGNAIGIIRSDTAAYAGVALFDYGADKRFLGASKPNDVVGVWKHFVLIMANGPDGTNDTDFILFEDGVPLAASSCPAGNFTDQTISRIGHDGADSPANCDMDDVRVFGHALTASEVARLFAKEDVTDGLTHHWRFEQDANDSVGSANGSMIGATLVADTPF